MLRLWPRSSWRPPRSHFHRKITDFGEHGERVMSFVMLPTVDDKWKDHLYDLDHLKASIGFRGWGQKDPLVEYKKDAYEMFVDLDDGHSKDGDIPLLPGPDGGAPATADAGGPAAHVLWAHGGAGQGRFRDRYDWIGWGARGGAGHSAGEWTRWGSPGPPGPGVRSEAIGVPRSSGPDPRQLLTNRGEDRKQTPVTGSRGPGRNDPCPCGSGKKYKKCCGKEGLILRGSPRPGG